MHMMMFEHKDQAVHPDVAVNRQHVFFVEEFGSLVDPFFLRISFCCWLACLLIIFFLGFLFVVLVVVFFMLFSSSRWCETTVVSDRSASST